MASLLLTVVVTVSMSLLSSGAALRLKLAVNGKQLISIYIHVCMQKKYNVYEKSASWKYIGAWCACGMRGITNMKCFLAYACIIVLILIVSTILQVWVLRILVYIVYSYTCVILVVWLRFVL